MSRVAPPGKVIKVYTDEFGLLQECRQLRHSQISIIYHFPGPQAFASKGSISAGGLKPVLTDLESIRAATSRNKPL
jgi:hypothetical protein